ncbi:hypothetical protein ACTFIY_012417 [Dictyostelium cf. discoideum]
MKYFPSFLLIFLIRIKYDRHQKILNFISENSILVKFKFKLSEVSELSQYWKIDYRPQSDDSIGSDIHLSTSANSMRNHLKDQFRFGTTCISTKLIEYLKGDKLEASTIEFFKFKKLD